MNLLSSHKERKILDLIFDRRRLGEILLQKFERRRKRLAPAQFQSNLEMVDRIVEYRQQLGEIETKRTRIEICSIQNWSSRTLGPRSAKIRETRWKFQWKKNREILEEKME